MITGQGTIVKIKTNIKGDAEFIVQSKTPITKLEIKVNDINFAKAYDLKNGALAFTQTIHVDKPLLWSLKTPNLYLYDLKVFHGEEVEEVQDVFAFRTLSVDNKNLCLNGNKLFIRGFIRGARAHEHLNNCNLLEEDFYRKNITEAKKFGFNYIRFHSTIPPESLFKVADELGMLIHIELRAPDDDYNNLEEMLFAEKQLVSNDFIQATIDKLYNHPSLAVYCIGNELKAVSLERIEAIGKFIKDTDSSRLFVDTCAWGKPNRANIDFDVQHMSYYFPFGTHAEMYNDIESLHTYADLIKQGLCSAELSLPMLAHEVCHYTALRDFEGLKKKFQTYKTEEPWWIDEELKMIEAKGFKDNYEQLYQASKKFQFECWKTAFEAMRKSEILGGFQFLQFSDTDKYENSNGIVDCFDDENYIQPEDFLTFNGDKVLIADLGGRIYRQGQKIEWPIVYSDYSEDNDGILDFEFVLKSTAGETLLCKKLPDVDVTKKGLQTVGVLSFELPASSKSTVYNVQIRLVKGNEVITENHYKIWGYPVEKAISYRDFCNFEENNCMITDDMQKALKGLKAGKKVCLIYRSAWTRHVANKSMPNPDYAFKATWNRFKPVIWDRGTNFGGLCDEKLLNEYGFATETYYDFNMAKLTEDCDKIILDDFPVKVKSILSGTDKSSRDRFDAYAVSFNLPELQYDRTLRNFSYLFELKVGEGDLLVCGLNMTGLDYTEPSTVAMAQFIQNYLRSSDFAPVNQIGYEPFISYLKASAEKPIKERMMTQFWQLDDTPVESKEYWIESRAYLTER